MIRINKLYIKNFKVFKEINFDFTNFDFTVFDGPNGFGKTTIYDAIELLITGKIRRYLKLGKDTTKRTQKFKENPYFCSEGDKNSIIIRAEIRVDDKLFYIQRETPNRNDLVNTYTFDYFQLFSASSFDFSNKETKENDFLKIIFGDYYKENFEFLNYVEQEDSYYLLKNHQDIDRKKSISHFFNTKEFEDRIEHNRGIKKRINNLITPLNSEIEVIKAEIDRIEKKISNNKEVKYDKLLIEVNELWDLEDIDFSIVEYSDIVGLEGELNKIKKIVKEKINFKSYLSNSKANSILGKEKDVLNLIKYGNFIEKREILFNSKEIQNSIIEYINKISEIDSSLIVDQNLDIPEIILTKYESEIPYHKFKKTLSAIQESIITSKDLTRVHSKLVDSREKLEESFNSKNQNEKQCPFCGYNWESNKELLKNIKEQTVSIANLASKSETQLQKQIVEFKKTETEALLNSLKGILLENHFNDKFFNADFFKLDKKTITELSQNIKDIGVNTNNYIISKETEDFSENHIKFVAELKGMLKPVNEDNIEPYFHDYYHKYFSNNFKNIDSLNISYIENKIKYIDWKYSIYQSNSLKKRQDLLNIRENRLLLIKKELKTLDSVNDIYKRSLTEYNKKLIKDIELLFHIYSGRIIQDFQGGLGLFIQDNNGLRFVTSPDKSFDAIFSMSAGQLSALIIAFTLSLNKIYSQNKILFIDDPVQTMDEINIAGFIELLRNDFEDRQIFISTHETMMSTYMRYKFKKFNLRAERINVKEKVEANSIY